MGFYFTQANGVLYPTPQAHTPWSADMLHGRFLGAIGARAVESEIGQRHRVCRLTVDLFRPAPLEPITVEVSKVRSGRSLRLLDANIIVADRPVARVTALALREGENPPGNVFERQFDPWPDPESVAVTPHLPETDFAEQRIVEGGLGSGKRTRIWAREFGSLVEGEPNSPLVGIAMGGDLALPIANCSDQGLFYINADYTMLLSRYPVGEWVGFQSDLQLQSTGISVASSVFFDTQGPIGTSSGVSIARPPLTL